MCHICTLLSSHGLSVYPRDLWSRNAMMVLQWFGRTCYISFFHRPRGTWYTYCCSLDIASTSADAHHDCARSPTLNRSRVPPHTDTLPFRTRSLTSQRVAGLEFRRESLLSVAFVLRVPKLLLPLRVEAPITHCRFGKKGWQQKEGNQPSQACTKMPPVRCVSPRTSLSCCTA